MGIINFAEPITGNFLVDIILWLVTITSSVAWGVVLFTIILKLITLPFDYFSRALMRKNSVKMEEMRPELEKLQQQCANNKDLYNQKMMALYKKNGYSMFGACLPTILTLVIFILAINGFTAYSKYQNQKYFYDMSVSYNNVLYTGFDYDNDYIKYDSDKKIIVIDDERLFNATSPITVKNADDESFDIIVTKVESATDKYITVETTNSFVKYTHHYEYKDGNKVWGQINYSLASDAESKVLSGKLATKANNMLLNYEGKNFTEAKAAAAASETPVNLTLDDFIVDIQQTMSAKTFRHEKMRFLWVKNIWVPDSPMKHPVEQSWAAFKQMSGYPASANDIGDKDYGNLIAKLDVEKNSPNGYFILVALTAGISFLMQWVMKKSNQAQMELQTVDGQGAMTQKFMMWMMPIMMAVFAFVYTAAFSLYIVLSSAISIGTTFLINFIVDKQMARAKIKAGKGEKSTLHGRVYTKEEEEAQEKKEKEKKKRNDKFDSESTGDFLNGDVKEVNKEAEPKKENKKSNKKNKDNKKKEKSGADEPVKHVRGRLK